MDKDKFVPYYDGRGLDKVAKRIVPDERIGARIPIGEEYRKFIGANPHTYIR